MKTQPNTETTTQTDTHTQPSTTNTKQTYIQTERHLSQLNKLVLSIFSWPHISSLLSYLINKLLQLLVTWYPVIVSYNILTLRSCDCFSSLTLLLATVLNCLALPSAPFSHTSSGCMMEQHSFSLSLASPAFCLLSFTYDRINTSCTYYTMYSTWSSMAFHVSSKSFLKVFNLSGITVCVCAAMKLVSSISCSFMATFSFSSSSMPYR